MGDYAEMEFDRLLDEHLFPFDDDDFDGFCRRTPPGHWKTREGEIIKISDLEDDHLYNIVMHLHRKGKDNPEIAAEWTRRGFPRPGALVPLKPHLPAKQIDPESVKLSRALFERLRRVAVLSDDPPGMYPGVHWDEAPSQLEKLRKLGLVALFSPHNPIHKRRAVITELGSQYLKRTPPGYEDPKERKLVKEMRRAATAKQPKCRCGNCLSAVRVRAGVDMCPSCDPEGYDRGLAP